MTFMARVVALIKIGIGLTLVTLVACSADVGHGSKVKIARVPLEGIVPDAKLDDKGDLHVVFLAGEDVFYSASSDLGGTFSKPLRVNDRRGFAQGGLFRGPELAIGADTVLHVVWYNRAWELTPDKTQQGAMYSRRVANGAFEPSRNLSNGPSDGLSVAAHGEHVTVAWQTGERVGLRYSNNGGASFSQLAQLDALPCECCDTSVALSGSGTAYIAYRDRTDDRRDMFLAALDITKSEQKKVKLDTRSWIIRACPMSGVGLATSEEDSVVAWEHDGSIFVSRVNLADLRPSRPVLVDEGKYPIVLRNAQSLLVAWKDGSRLKWKMYDRSSFKVMETGSAGGVSPHRPSGVATATGEYILIP